MCWCIYSIGCSVDSVKSKEKPRVVKGCQSSRTAYMLVYRLQSLTSGLYTLIFARLRNFVENVSLNYFEIQLCRGNMKLFDSSCQCHICCTWLLLMWIVGEIIRLRTDEVREKYMGVWVKESQRLSVMSDVAFSVILVFVF